MIAYKFVRHDVRPLEALEGTEVFKLKAKVDAGDKLDRGDKDRLFGMLYGNGYSKVGVPLQGWMFDFSPVLRAYYVEYTHGQIEKHYAPDKTSIRNHPYLPGIVQVTEVQAVKHG